MICGVPQLKLRQEIKKLVFPYGIVKKVHVVSDYPTEEFTEAYHIHYEDIRSARIAKHFLDGKNFYGGILHVFYMPELESVSETRAKLIQRSKDVSVRIKRNKQEFLNSQSSRHCILGSSRAEETITLTQISKSQLNETSYQTNCTGFSIHTNQESDYTPNMSMKWRSSLNVQELLATRIPSETVSISNMSDASNSVKVTSLDKFKKKKNYKGQSIRDTIKVKIARPYIVDTTAVLKSNIKNIYTSSTSSEKKSAIVIKKISSNDVSKKKIILKNSSTKQLVQPSQDLQNTIQTVKSQIRSALQNCEKIHLS